MQQDLLFEAYPLAPLGGLAISCGSEDELFETRFPRPPPRFSRTQAERLARPSLPSLKHQYPVDSSLSSQDTSHQLSISISTGSIISLASYPSSTSSLSLLHSRHPLQQESEYSAGDDRHPYCRDVSSAQSPSLEPSESSTPVTPHSVSLAWRPKELNLVKKQTELSAGEPLPSLYAMPLWPSFEAKQFTDSPDTGTIDIAADSWSGPALGPKKLLLSTSGGPPSTKRFPDRRPSDSAVDLISRREAPSSGCPITTRSPLPVLPSTPTFTTVPLRSADADLDEDAPTPLTSAQDFVARIVSQPEYQASEHIDTADPLFFPVLPLDEAVRGPNAGLLLGLRGIPALDNLRVNLDKSGNESGFEANFGDDSDPQYAHDDQLPVSETPPSPAKSVSPEIEVSFAPRSRSHSFGRRKAPPTRLALPPNSVSSPASTFSYLDQYSPTSMSAHDVSQDKIVELQAGTSPFEQPLPTAFFDCASDTSEQSLVSREDPTATMLEYRKRSSRFPWDSMDLLNLDASEESQPFHSLQLAASSSQRTVPVFDASMSVQPSTSNDTVVITESSPPNFDTEIFKTQLLVSRQRHPYAYGDIDPKEVKPSCRKNSQYGEQGSVQTFLSEAYRSSGSVSSPCLPTSPDRRSGGHAVFDVQTEELETNRLRRSKFVPAPPSFAIRGASPETVFSAKKEVYSADSVDQQPMPSNALAQSRWSSGSEAEGDPIKPGSSFSINRKSFSSSRKSSFAQARDSASSRNSSQDTGEQPRLSTRTSRKASSSAAVQRAQIPAAPRRPLLSSFTSFRKKSFSKISSQPATPSTPASPPESSFSKLLSPTLGAFPFRQATESRTASLSAGSRSESQVGRKPTSEGSALSSDAASLRSAPLTTQQILAHAQSNVWPEDYFSGAFGRLMVSPRAAPRPPTSSTALTDGSENVISISAPGRPAQQGSLRNLRHQRQLSNASVMSRQRDLPTDLFKPVTPEFTNSRPPMSDVSNVMRSRRLSDEMGGRPLASLVDESQNLVTTQAPRTSYTAPIEIGKNGRRSRRNRHHCCAHYNSWTESGLEWVTNQAGHAFSVLLAEPLPFQAVVQTSGGSVVAAGRDGDDGEDEDDSDTDDYGSSDGGGGTGGGGYGDYNAGNNGGEQPSGDENDDKDEKSDASDDEDKATSQESSTDDESGDDYGAELRLQEHSSVVSDKASDSDSSDNRPLGQLVHDPRAVQKALRLQERKRHFDLAHKALSGEGKAQNPPPERIASRRAAAPGPIDVGDLNRRLARMQERKERTNASAGRPVQRSQTLAAHEAVAKAERTQTQGAAPLRSKSVRHQPSDRRMHPGLMARTPSEAALRSKAMAQSNDDTQLNTSALSAQMPLPPHALATVAAAQKALARAQAKPTPASIAEAQALAASATAALKSATANVNKNGSSPLSPSFGDRIHATADGAESATHLGRVIPPRGAEASVGHGVQPRLPARSASRAPAPPAINTTLTPSHDVFANLSSPKLEPGSEVASPHSTVALNALSSVAFHEKREPGELPLPLEQSSTAIQADSQRAITIHPSGNAVAGEACLPVKVYILSRQRFTTAEIPVSSRARDLVLTIVERERLPMDDVRGGWVVFDCSQQFGLERPLREYEIVNEVINVQSNPSSDYLLLKHTELAPYLSIRSIPQSSPELAGYVYVQDRRKKWNKRWLELRDHGLFHARNEKGKDEVFICQISTFDAYLVDPLLVKMPKATGFALRSQDKISMFEKPDQDYIHYFSLTDPAAHRDWVRAILNARSYVLRQEKAVLFQTDANAASGPAGGGISRRPTARTPGGRLGAEGPSSGRFPLSPLIDSNAFAGPFAKGSLLADKAISDAKEAIRGHPSPGISGALHDLSLAEREAVRLTELKRREAVSDRQR